MCHIVTFVEVTNYSKKFSKVFRKSLTVCKINYRQMRQQYEYLRGFAAYSEFFFLNYRQIDRFC
jgi:hypothetical protein